VTQGNHAKFVHRCVVHNICEGKEGKKDPIKGGGIIGGLLEQLSLKS
jgi:hypothetical protein